MSLKARAQCPGPRSHAAGGCPVYGTQLSSVQGPIQCLYSENYRKARPVSHSAPTRDGGAVAPARPGRSGHAAWRPAARDRGAGLHPARMQAQACTAHAGTVRWRQRWRAACSHRAAANGSACQNPPGAAGRRTAARRRAAIARAFCRDARQGRGDEASGIPMVRSRVVRRRASPRPFVSRI